MQKWEYKYLMWVDRAQADNSSYEEKISTDLNVLGNQGWELVSVQFHLEYAPVTYAYLKRPIV